MSFRATLTIDDKEFNLNFCNIYKSRLIDRRGRPSSAYGWVIRCAMDAIDDTIFTDWMINSSMQKDGKITFYKDDQESKLKEISFSRAYCCYLSDKFTSDISYMDTWIDITGSELNGVSN